MFIEPEIFYDSNKFHFRAIKNSHLRIKWEFDALRNLVAYFSHLSSQL